MYEVYTWHVTRVVTLSIVIRIQDEYNIRMDKEIEISYGMRFPQSVLNAMRKLAKEHDRSVNAEIVHALKQYIKQVEEPAKKEKV